MLTIFSMPKAFKGHFDVIQRNALRSWLELPGSPRIILMGDDPGTADVAAEFGVRHIAEIAKTPHGTPRVDAIFDAAWKASPDPWFCYVNADIMLTGDLHALLAGLPFKRALLCGRRTDIDIASPFEFDAGWQERLNAVIKARGRLHSATGIDYFLHSRRIFKSMPTFALGRTSWDNWILYECVRKRIPLVDATSRILAAHQDHDYSHAAGGFDEVWKGEETRLNLALARPGESFNIDRCTWKVTASGIERQPNRLGAKAVKRRLPAVHVSDQPLVSVVMPVHNRESLVAEAIESIRLQSYDRWELIAVNDGSTDGTGRVLDEMARSDARIKHVHVEKQKCIAAVRNIGIRKSGGDFVACMDSDDLSHKNRLSRQVRLLSSRRDLDAVTSWAEHRDLSGTLLGCCVTATEPEDIRIETPLRDPVVHASCMIGKSFYQKIGLNDESYTVSHDSKLWVDVAKAGGRVAALPEYLYTIRWHGSNITFRPESTSSARRAFGEFFGIDESEYAARAIAWIDAALEWLGDAPVCWGTGAAGRMLAAWLAVRNKKPAAYIERDPGRRASIGAIDGVPLIAPSELPSTRFSRVAIAAGDAHAEIGDQLRRMGYRREEHFMTAAFLLSKRDLLLKELNRG